ncbi:MAG: hypothetical protein ACTS5G_02855, partial [Burkholderiales bacterium]
GIFTFVIFGFTHLAARALHGRDYAVAAPLILAGSIGFLTHAHETQPMLLTLAAHFAAYWALAMLDRRTWLAAVIFGGALGAGMLGNGIAAMAPLVPIALLTLALSDNKRKTAPALLLALLFGGALLLIWLLPLYLQSPQYLGDWWQGEVKRFTQTNQPWKTALDYLNMLPWYAWPALPLAAWTLWCKRRLLRTPALAVPLFSFFAMLAGLSLSYEAHSVSALLLLPPLVLLAVPGIPSLRRGAANAFDWFGMMTFTLFTALIWTGWCAMVFGWPTRLAKQAARLEPGFTAHFSTLPVIVALLATTLWGLLIATSPRSPFRGMVHWVAGVTLFWLLAIALWLPWVEYGKTYRPVSYSLAEALPAKHGCIADIGLSEALRASFDYFSGITSVPGHSAAGQRCNWLLTQSAARNDRSAPGNGWHLTWEDTRSGDRNEKIRLY